MNQEKHRVLMSHILTTSSGTLASLSGYSKYTEVEAVTDVWVEFELDDPTEDGEWRTSWTRFAASDKYARLRAQLEWQAANPDQRFAHDTAATVTEESR
jgi:hypothetical protein